MSGTTSKPRVPRAIRAVFDALHFSGDRLQDLARLTDDEWRTALAYCDRNQLTLVLAQAADTSSFPQWVGERLSRDAVSNRDRFHRTLKLYSEVHTRFEQQRLEHLVLKGFSQWPYFAPDPSLRQQYDLDLFLPGDSVYRARDAVAGLSYEPIQSFDRMPTDHLPTMIRKTGWRWRGDFFDPEIPIAIELHFRFWDRNTERFGPTQLDDFWQRRERRTLTDQKFLCLTAPDALAYSSLHALRHLLRGDARPAHIYEIAWFLHRAQSDEFWSTWVTLHDAGLRQIQGICFGLARAWFGCGLAPQAEASIEALPQSVKRWFDRSAHAPLESQFRPNKDELWLHLALLSSTRDRAAVVRRRLAPLTLPGPVDAVHIPDAEMTWRLRLRANWRYVAHLTSRVIHHVRALGSLASAAPGWWASSHELSSRFWLFLCCAATFNFGLFLFFLLYNLHLLDRGFAEDLVGLVTGASTAGSIAGSLLAGALVTRAGLRAGLIVCFCGTALLSAARIFATSTAGLLTTGFLTGVCLCIWFVSVPLVVAQLTTERNRAIAFSLTLGSGIGAGILAGAAGGKLSALVGSKENVLFLGCALSLLAAVPASRLRFTRADPGRRTYSRHPFLTRFLAVLALWSLATGAFNPFFNVFFSRTFQMSVERIGWLFSASQLGQVTAILLAPVLFRRFGLAPAVAITQAAAACALAGISVTPAAAAGILYVAYMSFQYMGEPGIYSLLMNRLPADQRTGAAALNFFVLFGMQTIAASLAGIAITRIGYPALLFAAAALALAAALLVRILLHQPSPVPSDVDTDPACN